MRIREITWDIYSVYYDLIKIFPNYNKMHSDVISAMKLKDYVKVLDAGCGSGNLEEKISMKNIFIDAMDNSKKMIKKANKKFKGANKLNFNIGNLENKLQYDDNKYDRIVCINTLHVVKKQKELIVEFYRILKKGGLLIIVIPKKNFSMLSFIWDNIKTSYSVTPFFIIKILFVSIIFLPISVIISIYENNFIVDKITVLLKNFVDIKIKETYSKQSYLITANKV